ncbi:MAG TPA: DUF4043 domain-containing protein [Acidocella sp.]|nr:DUF4043 domain-containing protein [Acidocella sp.]
MSINNFPTALQGIIQQNFLEREFQDAIRAKLGFRAVADRMDFPNGVGETITKTRAGLLPVITSAMMPSANTNFDNGLSAQTWGVEQFTVSINEYAGTMDLNTVTNRVGLASQFLQNAKSLGEQSARSLDTLARNALFNTYMGGNTRVITTLGAPGTALHVDDIRGFQNTLNASGQVVPVSAGATVNVTVGSDVYTLIGAAADGSNISTAPNGISGTLTFSGNVTVADGTAPNAVVSAIAPVILRPNGRATTDAIIAGDTITMVGTLLNAASIMRDNNVPDIDGCYNFYLSNQQLQGLFADSEFQLLFRGAYGSTEYRQGTIFELMGIRFIPVNNVLPYQSINGLSVKRGIICGKGSIIEADFAGQDAEDTPGNLAIKHVVDGITMITREPMDRLQEIIAQSWKWIGGFCVPSDTTANPNTIPTANSSAFKRAIVIESL